MYTQHPATLADFTIALTIMVARLLGINHTKFIRSSAMPNLTGTKTDRLITVLQAVGADYYISGPSAQAYLEEDKLANAGIELAYAQYHYPEYEQLYPPFDPYVSVLDLLFM